MPVWQNFKDTDHEFEKKFFRAIILLALVVGFYFLIDKVFDNIPDAKKLLAGKLFLFFTIGLVVTCFITFAAYVRTLDFFETETKATIKASIFSVITWTIFWTSWSIFCAWLTINNKPLTLLVQVVIIVLVILPGLIAFFISRNIRRQQINDEEKSKLTLGDSYYKSDPYTLCLAKKYYSGNYGLICFPAYLTTLLVEHFI